MSEEKKYQEFSASDIERYHKGLLTPKEMNAIEKAALEDPFLADAIEGYTDSRSSVQSDLSQLKDRLAERIQGAKVVPIIPNKKRDFLWLRVAAMVVVLAGAGLLIYRFSASRSDKNIADLNSASKKSMPQDSIVANPATSSTADSEKDKPNNIPQVDVTTQKKESTAVNKPAIEKQTVPPSKKLDDRNLEQPSPVINQNNSDAAITPVTDGKSGSKSEQSNNSSSKTLSLDQLAKRKNSAEESGTGRATMLARRDSSLQLSTATKPANLRDNYFRGRVTDPNNNPVPFAKVTSTNDNVGTYTDVKGYYNLVSPDTVLDVEVRSIGFENHTAQLRNNVTNNQVVLEPENKSLSETVIINKQSNPGTKSRSNNLRVEEPEPADGWNNYNAYLENNLQMPDEVKIKKLSGKVEVSFEVDNKGQATKLRVEKSLCDECDAEALRLVKQGPRWKKNEKKKRTTIIVSF